MSGGRALRVLVTGAASGIGRATALRLAGPGVGLVLHTRKNADGLARVAAEAGAAGADVTTVLADLAAPDAGTRIIDAAGPLDQIVANAGFADKRGFMDLPATGVADSFAPIADGFFHLVRAAMPALKASERGRVVAVSSFVAHRFPHDGDRFPASAAAKAALEALVKALAAELAPDGVTVNCVSPGYTRKDEGAHAAISEERWREITARIPLGRLADPRDVAGAIAYLLGPDAAYVTGQTLHVDGGLGL